MIIFLLRSSAVFRAVCPYLFGMVSEAPLRSSNSHTPTQSPSSTTRNHMNRSKCSLNGRFPRLTKKPNIYLYNWNLDFFNATQIKQKSLFREYFFF